MRGLGVYLFEESIASHSTHRGCRYDSPVTVIHTLALLESIGLARDASDIVHVIIVEKWDKCWGL